MSPVDSPGLRDSRQPALESPQPQGCDPSTCSETSTQAEALKHVLPSGASATALPPWGVLCPGGCPCGRVGSMQSPDGQEGPAGGRAGVGAGSRRGSSRQQSTHVLGGWSSWVRTDEEAGHVPPGLGGAERELVDPLGAVAVHTGQAPPRQGTLPGASCASARPPPIPPRPHLNVQGSPSVSTALRVAPRQSGSCPLTDRSLTAADPGQEVPPASAVSAISSSVTMFSGHMRPCSAAGESQGVFLHVAVPSSVSAFRSRPSVLPTISLLAFYKP